jgi:tetratricopeptide (TPR) repeat protein
VQPIEEAATSARPRLHVSFDADEDLLNALEFGRVREGQPPGSWEGITDELGILHDGPEGAPVGFQLKDASAFDPDVPALDELADAPRFDAPALGLENATIVEIILGALGFFRGQSSLDTQLFQAATAADGLEAAHLWFSCLQTGEQMANFGLGYTLLELGRDHDAYRFLRRYTELAPSLAWAWCYRGRAAAAIGEHQEARMAYRRAIALEKDDDPTIARELLAELRGASE